MVCEVCLEDSCKKILEAFVRDDMSENYDYISNIFLYFEEALTSFKFEDFDKSFGSTYIDNVACWFYKTCTFENISRLKLLL